MDGRMAMISLSSKGKEHHQGNNARSSSIKREDVEKTMHLPPRPLPPTSSSRSNLKDPATNAAAAYAARRVSLPSASSSRPSTSPTRPPSPPLPFPPSSASASVPTRSKSKASKSKLPPTSSASMPPFYDNQPATSTSAPISITSSSRKPRPLPSATYISNPNPNMNLNASKSSMTSTTISIRPSHPSHKKFSNSNNSTSLPSSFSAFAATATAAATPTLHPKLLPPKPSVSVPSPTYDSRVPVSVSTKPQERQQRVDPNSNLPPRRARDAPSVGTIPLPISVSSSISGSGSNSGLSIARTVGGTASNTNANGHIPNHIHIVKEEPMDIEIPLAPPEPGPSALSHVKMETKNVTIPPLPAPPSSTPPRQSLHPTTLSSISSASFPQVDLMKSRRITNSPSIPWDLISIALSSSAAHNPDDELPSAGASSSKPSTARTAPVKPSSISDSELGAVQHSSPLSSSVGTSTTHGPSGQLQAKSRNEGSVLPTPPPSAPSNLSLNANVNLTHPPHSNSNPGPILASGPSPARSPLTLPDSDSASASLGSELPPTQAHDRIRRDTTTTTIIQSQQRSVVGVPLTPRTTSSVSPAVGTSVVSTPKVPAQAHSHSQLQLTAHSAEIRPQEREEGKKEEEEALYPDYVKDDDQDHDHDHAELDQLNRSLEDIMAKARTAALRAQRHAAGVGSRAHLSNVTRNSTIDTLTREAWDIKRQMTALVAREAVVIEELRKLDARWIPDAVRIKIGIDNNEAEGDGGSREKEMKQRIEKLEKQLEEERMLREEAENAIADVRRECKNPFVVPSLLDALVDLSKLTTKALRPPAGPGSYPVISKLESKPASTVHPTSSIPEAPQTREPPPSNSNNLNHNDNPNGAWANNLPSGPRATAISSKGKEVRRETRASSWGSMDMDGVRHRG
ncbi:hypothetical protein CPB84DRAFT_1789187 [Gymnopilus junonius]|uniref:Uncharacterized protein n=1 Tax=Gymnopilus junonius TaxID=109634 RepID=A0A9P5NH16_GYMJU|nr:hypothetical protein CPB84DRAFT_1789187 [Gymnopilus junonius]